MTPYDEMTASDGSVREAYRELEHWLTSTTVETFRNKRKEADLLFRRLGITFAETPSG